MKKQLFFILSVLITAHAAAANIDLYSPDKRIKVSVDLQKKITYSVSINNTLLLKDAWLQLNLKGQQLGDKPKLIKQKINTVNTTSYPVVPFKNSKVVDNYNLLRLDFKNDFSVEFRAYNDGVAYRFITAKKDSVIVQGEDAQLNFNGSVQSSSLETGSFKTAYEIQYKTKPLADVDKGKMNVLPILFNTQNYKILVSEADLYGYPCLFIKTKSDNSVAAVFAKQPVEFGPDGDRSVKIEKEADYIAKTTGNRTFPWRFMVITNDDRQLVATEMTYKLSTPNKLADTKWIKPGQVTWEWWHDAKVYGVDFKSGYNQETYQYYIDFAAKHGIPYILMDEGWAKTTMNPFDPNPTINLHELIAYGNKRNVKIILWFTWLAVEKNWSVFKTLHEWGIAGMKIDFMERNDQWMVNYYTRVAKEAAKNQLLVDFHGSFKPAGLERAYPNVLSYEAVVGMEQNIGGGFATPNNNLYLPFLRNAVGPMDYTPGAMQSVHPEEYHGNRNSPISIGTRAHQLAMYVVFNSGLQMLADNPYNYLKEPESTQFITSVPVTWDESKVLEAKAGQYIAVARRKGNKWFIGAMTNSTARDITITADFLNKNTSYTITLIKDGINADAQPLDYKRIVKPIKAGDKIDIKMVADGGYVCRIEALNNR